MDSVSLLLDGFATAATPTNLAYALIGVLLGTLVGVLPGIGPAMTVALLLPVTYNVEPVSAFIMFAGIYYGGMYGGSTTSILLNTPGESASVITAIEGNKMAKKGRAAQALATAAIGSFIAGTIGTLLVAFFTPALADQAVKVGAPSYFAIMLLSMVLVLFAISVFVFVIFFATPGVDPAARIAGRNADQATQRWPPGMPDWL